MTTDQPIAEANDRVPKVIRIDHTAERMLVDGEPFPWLITEAGPLVARVDGDADGMPVVGVQIFADRVEVVLADGREEVHEFGALTTGPVIPPEYDA